MKIAEEVCKLNPKTVVQIEMDYEDTVFDTIESFIESTKSNTDLWKSLDEDGITDIENTFLHLTVNT
jgi:hypothetical protein